MVGQQTGDRADGRVEGVAAAEVTDQGAPVVQVGNDRCFCRTVRPDSTAMSVMAIASLPVTLVLTPALWQPMIASRAERVAA
ncbi:hypothetical protein [Salinispora arenicola]|uniref:hypothetical protein n=1 Tax=Salinispora arenicola TaxID=168697 RepID=UPI0012BBCFF7|nr:hypothetical protein [Salinispora arenicola]